MLAITLPQLAPLGSLYSPELQDDKPEGQGQFRGVTLLGVEKDKGKHEVRPGQRPQ